MYSAISRRDSAYEGIFYTAVKTTGIFCRPTCKARTPLAKNIEFFPTTASALAAGYRACKRCKPLDQPGTPPRWLTDLRTQVDRNPSKVLRDTDLRAMHLEPATARRQFKRHYGMTFHAYARARRVGTAFQTLRTGKPKMTQLQSAAGYESESGFREACERLLGSSNPNHTNILPARWLTTPLGPMLALADDTGLHALEYIDRRGLERQLLRLRKSINASILPADHPNLDAIEKEMALYFEGKSTLGHPLPTNSTPLFPNSKPKPPRPFPIPLTPKGSDFQHQVWTQLRQIPLGTTISYGELAKRIHRPTASRAVARANGDNFLAIVIPCHRVIGSDGSPTGYGGGIWRKLWLLEHEKKMLA